MHAALIRLSKFVPTHAGQGSYHTRTRLCIGLFTLSVKTQMTRLCRYAGRKEYIYPLMHIDIQS